MSTYASSAAIAVKATSNGNTSSGNISIPGLLAGDVLVKVIPNGFDMGFEDVVSNNDSLVQIASLDWSPVIFTFIFMRGV